LKGTEQGTKDISYKTIIRPQLKYCSSAWDTYTQELIDELEAIQKRAASRVTRQVVRWRANHEKQVSATALVNQLGWGALQGRKKMDRLSVMHNVYKGERGVEGIVTEKRACKLQGKA
jgi:hypothetical protein